jgi:predicted O-methyltransferase YrrM
MDDAPDLEFIRAAFKRDPVYTSFVSQDARRVLDEIMDDSSFLGATDPPALSMLALLIRLTHPMRVLQLGTHVGFSAIVIADLIAAHGGRLTTVDPVPMAHELASGWVEKAGLTASVRFVDGASTDEAAHAEIGRQSPYDLVYLDSSHAYASTLEELELIFERQRWLDAHGLLVLHDAAAEAARFDPSAEGGVPRALSEWISTRGDAYQMLILEPPLWPAPCGIGFLARRPG